MKRDNDKFNLDSKDKAFESETAEGILEISSTGYGLESVSKDEASHTENQPENSSGCGGL
ncbi:hypothetical protein J7I93_16855 [Bacillus sp. ISL-47]|uniref:hypothetical protein n=1 Tax=Bacillus sp. ISL-47 TaxID=2819130 RepID=UPI001BEA5016|nr:hypothetical protein [Bacillus sp. ISL-47]MBT2689858.1 hypothetical protein [Bacillus sp. ISL-47]MBT2710235.1 hypothetical protein [Pseudomonas sp. ISL-84]